MSDRGLAGQALSACALIAFLLGTFWTVTLWLAGARAIEGRSMAPTLLPGDRVVVDRWTPGRRPPRRGEIVVAEGPGGLLLVKRVTRLAPGTTAAWIWLEGDNHAASDDSRSFGPLAPGSVRGLVVWRYWPPSRFGPVGREPATGLRLPAR